MNANVCARWVAKLVTRTVALLSAIGAAAGCTPPADHLRPSDPTYSAAAGDACRSGEPNPKPLVVDWRPDMRADLEVAMQQGLAVVRHDCDRLELLSSCTVSGRYDYVAVTLKEQTLRMSSEEEGSTLLRQPGGDTRRGKRRDEGFGTRGGSLLTRLLRGR